MKEWIYQLILPTILKIYRSPRSYNSQVGVPYLCWVSSMTRIIPLSRQESPARRNVSWKNDSTTIGIFTHLGDAHDENFTSKEEKLAEKAKLFRSCKWVIGQTGETLEHIRVTYLHLFPSYYGEDKNADITNRNLYISKGTAT
ncbi:MAG: hypothetical protein ACLU4N_08125 [Butyricimonas faecihominis]